MPPATLFAAPGRACSSSGRARLPPSKSRAPLVRTCWSSRGTSFRRGQPAAAKGKRTDACLEAHPPPGGPEPIDDGAATTTTTRILISTPPPPRLRRSNALTTTQNLCHPPRRRHRPVPTGTVFQQYPPPPKPTGLRSVMIAALIAATAAVLRCSPTRARRGAASAPHARTVRARRPSACAVTARGSNSSRRFHGLHDHFMCHPTPPHRRPPPALPGSLFSLSLASSPRGGSQDRVRSVLAGCRTRRLARRCKCNLVVSAAPVSSVSVVGDARRCPWTANVARHRRLRGARVRGKPSGSCRPGRSRSRRHTGSSQVSQSPQRRARLPCLPETPLSVGAAHLCCIRLPFRRGARVRRVGLATGRRGTRTGVRAACGKIAPLFSRHTLTTQPVTFYTPALQVDRSATSYR